MNQILSMQPNNEPNPKKQAKQPKVKKEKIKKEKNQYNQTRVDYNSPSGNKASIVSIVRVFCILIILFGLTLIGDATYGIISSKPKLADEPQVTANPIGAEVTISAVGQMPISQIQYRWGQGETTTVQGNGTVELETKTKIPTGNNILNIIVTDYYGNEYQFQKQYINEQDESSKPTIEISVSGNMLNITAKDETEMSYLTYQWNDEEPTRVDLDSTSTTRTQIRASVEVLRGQNTLTITAVDNDGNTTTQTETIKGANRPTFTVTAEGTNLVINAQDEEGISKIAITVDGVTTDTGDAPLNKKEIRATQEITPGTHTVTITVTNISGLAEEQSFTVTL